MEIIEINDNMLEALHLQAVTSERKRMHYDLRTTAEDGSQRMLNALEVGAKVPIHRHLETAETVFCLQGCLDVVFYVAEGMEENLLVSDKVRLNPHEGKYGVQIPVGVWHTVHVYEPSTIFEVKDGVYKG